MECFTFLFMGLIIITGAAQFIDWLKRRRMRNQFNIAENSWKSNEYADQQMRSGPSDLDYLQAIVLLEMAEDGFFLPDGQRVFERLDNPDQYRQGQFNDSTCYEDEYYDDYYDEDSEYSDHWGLG